MAWRIEPMIGPSKKEHPAVELNEKETRWAYCKWERYYDEIFHYKWPHGQSAQNAQIEHARIRLALKIDTVAERLGVTKHTYYQYELREKEKTITLEQIEKVAQAMNCEFKYEICPKNGKAFAQLMWDQLWPIARTHQWLVHCEPNRKAYALPAIMRDLMLHHKIRKSFGWTRNRQ